MKDMKINSNWVSHLNDIFKYYHISDKKISGRDCRHIPSEICFHYMQIIVQK